MEVAHKYLILSNYYWNSAPLVLKVVPLLKYKYSTKPM